MQDWNFTRALISSQIANLLLSILDTSNSYDDSTGLGRD